MTAMVRSMNQRMHGPNSSLRDTNTTQKTNLAIQVLVNAAPRAKSNVNAINQVSRWYDRWVCNDARTGKAIDLNSKRRAESCSGSNYLDEDCDGVINDKCIKRISGQMRKSGTFSDSHRYSSQYFNRPTGIAWARHTVKVTWQRCNERVPLRCRTQQPHYPSAGINTQWKSRRCSD